MSFVQVKALQFIKTQGRQHAHAADAENDFLAQSIMLIAAIEIMRQGAIPIGIFRHVGVEKITGTVRSPGPATSYFHARRTTLRPSIVTDAHCGSSVRKSFTAQSTGSSICRPPLSRRS